MERSILGSNPVVVIFEIGVVVNQRRGASSIVAARSLTGSQVIEAKVSAHPTTLNPQGMKLTERADETCGTNSNMRHNRVPRSLHLASRTAPLPYLD